MAGDTPRALAREFGQIRALRPKRAKVVCHASLSIAPGERLTDDQWRTVAKRYLEDMGFKESQYVITKHTDTEHPHIHIVVNRVTIRGEVVSDSYDYKRQEAIMRHMEVEYGLTRITPSRDVPRKSVSKGEVEHVLRTGEASVRMRLQQAVDAALKERTELRTFVDYLANIGIETKLNQASTGIVSGISFSLDGVAMKGSDLGKAYTFNSLQKRGLFNEQIRTSTGHELGFISRKGERSSNNSQRIDRGRNLGNASELVTAAGYAEIEKQCRIDKNFERLASYNQGCDDECTEVCTRSKGLSR